MRITADRTSCIGAGTCVGMAPAHFDQDESDGTVVVITDEVGADDEAAIRMAIEACPVGALALLPD